MKSKKYTHLSKLGVLLGYFIRNNNKYKLFIPSTSCFLYSSTDFSDIFPVVFVSY